MQDLETLQRFIGEACTRAGANTDTAFALRLAVEEVFANIYDHGYAAREGPVEVSVSCDAGVISVRMADQAPPFDPADAPAPDLDPDWEKRKLGGLGLHLVRQLTDEVTCRRGIPRGNVFTLVKRLPVQPGQPLSGRSGA